MKGVPHRRPSWRANERAFPPELWIVAAVAVGMLLVEVWQSSRVAELCLGLDQTRSALVQARARVEFVHAQLDRRTTRAELAPLAAQLGLVPADAQQVVNLPSEYLADGGTPSSNEPTAVLALAERASRAIVPEARARDRGGN